MVISPVVIDLVTVDGPNEPVRSVGIEHEVVVNQINVSSINVAPTPSIHDACSVTNSQLVIGIETVLVVEHGVVLEDLEAEEDKIDDEDEVVEIVDDGTDEGTDEVDEVVGTVDGGIDDDGIDDDGIDDDGIDVEDEVVGTDDGADDGADEDEVVGTVDDGIDDGIDDGASEDDEDDGQKKLGTIPFETVITVVVTSLV